MTIYHTWGICPVTNEPVLVTKDSSTNEAEGKYQRCFWTGVHRMPEDHPPNRYACRDCGVLYDLEEQ